MLEVLPAPEHVVAMRVSGQVDKDDIERGIAAVEEALARGRRIALYIEIAMTGMTPGAFARDLGYGLRHLSELRRFARMAVVTEQEWVRRIVQVQGRILPQIEIRTFAPGERDEALTWVAQPITAGEPEAAQAPPSVRLIETTTPDVIAFEVNGRIRRDDIHLLVSAFEQALGAHERLRVLVRIVTFDGITLDALRQEGLASVKMRGWRQVERYALVGGPAWMASVTGWAAPLTRIQTRHFDAAQEDEAWRWLEAEPRIGNPA
ncbi:STAS/SEC14 domain-containing protein [Microvirga sp. Mcv34]|uniref:STAS/SEC14 domain-containing protein n=1 Tax=Microvirga sp. Mcv34 TaxID=2926016 RepID=UPI0021C852E2|nr:STAS/SEC14 domain-containing protein [Microvirga sp. Mcv34]